ncbi:MAG: hypothetical protein IPH72_14325 [Sandaracinaceae bacterium]|nr:hypothetical protein [Sandaracinaceae bacterium]
MLKIVPDPEAPAKPPVSRRLHDAFRAEMDALPDVTDFASLERAALELANRVVHAHMTRALEALVKEHGTEDVLVDGERYRFHAWGTGRYPSLVGTLEVVRPTFRKVGVRNGPTVVPLELAAEIVEDATGACQWV